MSVGRITRGFLAMVVIGVAAVATLPTIWQDSIANLQHYLGLPEPAAVGVTAGLAVLLVGVPLVVKGRRAIRVRRQHRAVRSEAIRRLES